jgi:hypothetical protein
VEVVVWSGSASCEVKVQPVCACVPVCCCWTSLDSRLISLNKCVLALLCLLLPC